jgi:hypothetical protein
LRQNSRFDVDLKAIVLSGRVTVNGKTMPALPFGRGKLVFRHHKGGTASSLSFGREGEARYQVKLFPGVYDISYQPDSTCSPKESTIPCLSYPLATGKQLMQSGSLSFDLPVVELSGRMTLSGKTMPSSVSSYRGGLSFQLAGGGSVGTGSFAKSGDIRFRVRLFAGTYGIRYVPSSSCDRERDPLPCQSLSVRSGLVIKQNSTYNVDLKAVAISGVLSRNGIKLTDVPKGAIVRFESLEEGTGGLSFLLASSGTLRYQGKIFAGTYKVMYKPPGACSENFAFPCMAHQLRSSVTLRQASQLDLDAKVTQIAGQVTVNKASPPAHIASRGALSFSSPWGTVFSKPFPASGPMQYQVKLFVARYTVSYKSGSRCQRGEGIPCQSLKVASDLSIVQASQKHFDLPVVTLASHVTLRGAALPASTRGRGTLQYLPTEGQPQGTTTSVSFGTSGDVVVKQRLFAGTYNIVYRPSSTCREPSPLPCQQMLYKRGLVVTQPSTFHVDLTSIQVAGSVTLAGKAIPTATGERGSLVFSRKDGGTVRTTSFPRAGTLRYQVQLFPGEYTISTTTLPLARKMTHYLACRGSSKVVANNNLGTVAKL